MVGTFFIKASTYEFMKFHDLGKGDSYYYSFEHYGNASLWNFLFPNEKPPIPRGVTHGDELIYLFSTNVFNLTPMDWEIARVITEPAARPMLSTRKVHPRDARGRRPRRT